jgi:2-iminobutanoate/2-iminopropanoate deaminase
LKNQIDMGLPEPSQPFAWAISSGEFLFTTHGPVLADGRILQGSTADQAHLTFQHFQSAAKAAGGSMDDYVQLQIFLTDRADVAVVDEIYRLYFRPPYPNRATVIVAGLVVPEMNIEVTGIARIVR